MQPPTPPPKRTWADLFAPDTIVNGIYSGIIAAGTSFLSANANAPGKLDAATYWVVIAGFLIAMAKAMNDRSIPPPSLRG